MDGLIAMQNGSGAGERINTLQESNPFRQTLLNHPAIDPLKKWYWRIDLLKNWNMTGQI